MIRFLSICLIMNLLTLFPAAVEAELISILPDSSKNLERDIKGFQQIQEQAFADYSKAFTRYQADIEELQLKRRVLLKKMNDPAEREKMAKDGTLHKYYLRTWENLLLSIKHQIKRIDLLLCLKERRKDIIFRVVEDLKRQVVVNTTELEKAEKNVAAKEKEFEALKAEAQKLLDAGKANDSRAKVLKVKITQCKKAIADWRNMIQRMKRKQQTCERSSKLMETSAIAKIENAYGQFKIKRQELFDRLKLLDTEIKSFNPNIEMEMLIQSFEKEGLRLEEVTQAIEGFDEDYQEMIQLDTAIVKMVEEQTTAFQAREQAGGGHDMEAELRKLLED